MSWLVRRWYVVWDQMRRAICATVKQRRTCDESMYIRCGTIGDLVDDDVDAAISCDTNLWL